MPSKKSKVVLRAKALHPKIWGSRLQRGLCLHLPLQKTSWMLIRWLSCINFWLWSKLVTWLLWGLLGIRRVKGSV